MRVHVARICVLYEDLEIEWAGAEAEKIAQLDRTGMLTRRFYFVRRALLTLDEIQQAIHALQRNKEFKKSKCRWSTENQRMWRDAVKLFSRKQRFLSKWRDDIGGHFGDKAAEFALDNVRSTTVGLIEIYERRNGADVKMPFAYELVAAAMVKNKAEGQGPREFLEEAYGFLLEATRQAINACQVIVLEEVLPRF